MLGAVGLGAIPLAQGRDSIHLGGSFASVALTVTPFMLKTKSPKVVRQVSFKVCPNKRGPNIWSEVAM